MKANVNGIVVQLVFLDLKIFTINGPSGKISPLKTVPLTDEWKDRDFGFGPAFDGTTQFKDGTIVQTINLTTNKPNVTFQDAGRTFTSSLPSTCTLLMWPMVSYQNALLFQASTGTLIYTLTTKPV
jgi:hypothetical protein